ncbi:hypothetical protein B0H13DRAFT_2353932 [Mycena leptocephala]|nr:hypothetical protein B0H13DRAFT_2353932 [Mycena leptocephala]
MFSSDADEPSNNFLNLSPLWFLDRDPHRPPPRITKHGAAVPGHEFYEFSSPFYDFTVPYDPILFAQFDWEERELKRDFQRKYQVSPPHPARSSHSPEFLTDTACLIGHLACAWAIFLRRNTAWCESQVVEQVLQDAMSPLLTHEYLSAWLGIRTCAVARKGVLWSWNHGPYDDDEEEQTWGSLSANTAAGTLSTWDSSSGWDGDWDGWSQGSSDTPAIIAVDSVYKLPTPVAQVSKVLKGVIATSYFHAFD